MQRILYTILILGMALFNVSCESYLEEIPQNKLCPSTTADYEQLLNHGYITEQVMPYLDFLSDDVFLNPEDHLFPKKEDYGYYAYAAYMWQTSHEYTLSGKEDRAFRKFYESIYYANLVIQNIDNASGVVLDPHAVEKARKNLKGEAYALKAYSYFYLVNLYAKAYDPATCETDLGVPYTESVNAEDKAYTRSTVKVIYDHMVEDLLQAIDLMDKYPIEKSKYQFTSISARALLARVYLYMHDWDGAIKYAKSVIDENPSIFNLQEAGEVLNMGNNVIKSFKGIYGTDYLSKNNENVLFVNGFNELMPALTYFQRVTTFSVNKELAELYEPEDVRRCYFMVTHNSSRVKLTYAKNRDPKSHLRPDISAGFSRVIRTEEMYLILAEAYANKQNGMSDAIHYLNMMRMLKFRKGKYQPLHEDQFDQKTLLDFIYLERRLELCFEGHRWFDLRRTTRPAMERTGYDNEVARLEKDDPRYVLQIPQNELNINPAIGMNPR